MIFKGVVEAVEAEEAAEAAEAVKAVETVEAVELLGHQAASQSSTKPASLNSQSASQPCEGFLLCLSLLSLFSTFQTFKNDVSPKVKPFVMTSSFVSETMMRH